MPFAVIPVALAVDTVRAPAWCLHVWAWLDARSIDGVCVTTQGDIAEALGIPRTSVNRASQWLVAKQMSSKRAEAFMSKFAMDPSSRSKLMIEPQGDLFGDKGGTGRFFNK